MAPARETTSLLEMAMVAACDLPAEMQGEITRLILAYPSDESFAAVTPDEASSGDDQSRDDPRAIDGS